MSIHLRPEQADSPRQQRRGEPHSGPAPAARAPPPPNPARLSNRLSRSSLFLRRLCRSGFQLETGPNHGGEGSEEVGLLLEKSLLSALCRDGTCSDRQWWGLRWSVTPGTRPECSLKPRPCFRGGRRRPNRDREAWEETRKRGREGFVPPSLDHLVVSPPRACAKGSGRGRG